jgi:hypothetical protein
VNEAAKSVQLWWFTDEELRAFVVPKIMHREVLPDCNPNATAK